MAETNKNVQLPPIPAKRYFTIGEVSDLCGVKPHVLRYWEQEFTQLKPVKRRGNRRYYQHHEVLLIRKIRELLYEQGFTISGARNRLDGAEDVDITTENTVQQTVSDPNSQYETAIDFISLRLQLQEVITLLRA
jgi:DNA-binding transcriptional MerR regulator